MATTSNATLSDPGHAAVTSLDPQETKSAPHPMASPGEHPRARESSVAFRHRAYQWHRTKVVRAFEANMAHETRVFAYLGCGTSAWVMRSRTDPEHFALRSECCHDRWCPACSKSRAMVLRCNLEPLLKGRAIRFVTLTLKHDDSPLNVKLDLLHSCFDALRQRSFWTAAVDAGVAFLEVKHNTETSRWHPHLHVLCVGRYLPQATLKSEWLAVTGTSHIVDVRLVKDENKVAQYVTKYITKPCPNDLYRDHAALCEAIRTLKGRRLVTTFGAWRGHALLKNETLDDWEPLMPWPELLTRCREGDPIAIGIYRSVSKSDWIADDTSLPSTRASPSVPDYCLHALDQRIVPQPDTLVRY